MSPSPTIISAEISSTQNRVYYSRIRSYGIDMDDDTYTWNKPPRDIPVGTLVRFVSGRARFQGEGPRDPGADNDGEILIGQLAITVSGPDDDAHGWGGIFNLSTVRGDSLSHYGDFLEIVQ